MRQLLIGDCHFGIKSNAISWLECQLKFFRKQIFNIIKNENLDRIVFLGDLTDIRYSINQQIGIELKKLIRELAKLFDGEIVFVAGNHDYYSPLEEFLEYNSYELLFGEEFLKCYPNIIIVNKTPKLLSDGSLCLPWYYTENTSHFDEILYRYNFKEEVKCIFCHADLSVWPGARITALRGVPVYSGHIHYVQEDQISKLYNIGAVFPLTFNDVNQSRYVYIIDDTYSIVYEIKNVTTPMFKRYYNDDIFNLTDDVFTNAFVQLYISDTNMSKLKYVEQLKYIKEKYNSQNISVHIITSDDISDRFNIDDSAIRNISQYIDENIPEHLTKKYNIIKTKISES